MAHTHDDLIIPGVITRQNNNNNNNNNRKLATTLFLEKVLHYNLVIITQNLTGMNRNKVELQSYKKKNSVSPYTTVE